MRKWLSYNPLFLLLLVVGLGNPAIGQDSASKNQAQDSPPPAQSATTAPDDDGSSAQVLDLSDQVIRDILSPLQRGLEAHSTGQVLGIFDQQGMTNYSAVRDELVAFFRQYDAIQFRYQILQAVADKGQGFATADVDMDASPPDETQVPLRRTLQMRFQIKLGSKGWRVIGFKPSDVFSQ